MRFLELSSPKSLPRWSLDEELEIRLAPSGEELAASSSTARRSSPIHPLVPEAEVPDLRDGIWYIHLLVPVDAFTMLGKISGRAYPGLEDQTWFGIGLASVVIFSREAGQIGLLIDDLKGELVAHEEWRSERGCLASARLVRHPEPVEGDSSLSLPPLSDNLSSDLRGVVEEFGCSFRELYRWARVYAPDEVQPLGLLFKEVSTIITELLWLRSRGGRDIPKGLRESDLTDTLVCSQLVQQRMDRIVQINSALSYVVSQGCFGAPPILADSCLVRRHSLLGVGRAHRALVNLMREIEATLNSRSIPASVYHKWHIYRALEGLDSASKLDSSSWPEHELPDVLLPGPADPQPPKLVYFSGRLGFREAEYSISAAIHTLTSADSPEWHLSTMTHEILHGHVRDVVDAIFDRIRPDEPKKIGDFWIHIFKRFCAQMDGDLKGGKLIDSARAVLLAYCCVVQRMGSLTHLPAKPRWDDGRGLRLGEVIIPDSAPILRQQLEQEVHNISEIMVHVLDLYYFYDDDFESYNRAVWSSWKEVPSVLRDVRQYVLRMLLAKASSETSAEKSSDDGDEIGRFARARNQLRESIVRLSSDLGGNAVLERALMLLQLSPEDGITERTAEGNHALFQPFWAALVVVDFVRNCIASGKVREALFPSDIVGEIDGEAGFQLEFTPGVFSDRRVPSVAEFTAWRARSRNGDLVDEAVLERQSAWLFLACGRLPLITGGHLEKELTP
jgi:hypothetical protein